MLGLIDQVDPVRTEVGRLDSLLGTTGAEVARLEEVIATAWRQIDAQIGRHEESKRGITATISPELIALYEQLRKSKEGVAVGRLTGGQCGGCHLALSLPEQAEAADWDPPRCSIACASGPVTSDSKRTEAVGRLLDGAPAANPGRAAIGAALYELPMAVANW